MKAYLDKVRMLLEKFEEWQLIQISKEENHHVNVLVKLEPFSPIEFIVSAKIEAVKSPSINEGLSILPIAFCDNSMGLIIGFLKEEKLPEDKLEARKLRLRAARYVIIGKTLYKMGSSMPYL